jgi:shikimate kinase|tara:strand:- start:2220 stop:2756 length:537 start_codon:yes stop_codon:yes gene_type:complete
MVINNNNNNIFLIGPMGSGKTSVGIIVANMLSKKFFDTDSEIESITGVNIAYIFDIEGELGFRKREEKVVAEVTQRQNIVLATGGGAVESSNSRQRIKDNGFVVYLETNIEDQLKRAKPNNRRPLLKTSNPEQKLKELAIKRKEFYESIATLVVQTKGQRPKALAEQIIENFNAHRDS